MKPDVWARVREALDEVPVDQAAAMAARIAKSVGGTPLSSAKIRELLMPGLQQIFAEAYKDQMSEWAKIFEDNKPYPPPAVPRKR